MKRKISLSPLKQWEDEEKYSKIGLLTLYRMQNQNNTLLPQDLISCPAKKQNKIESISPKERYKKAVNQQMDKIFSHKSVFDKRKKYLSNQKKKKLFNQIKPVEDKKILSMKQYSFGEMNQEQSHQSWLKNKIYREFIAANGNTQRNTEQRTRKDVLFKVMNKSNQSKQSRFTNSNRFHTETSDLFREEEVNQTNTINSSEKSNQFLQAQFLSRRKKYFNKKNTNNFRDYFRKNNSKGPKYNELDNYYSNLLTNSLQNIPYQAINEAYGSTPRTDRLKDTIKQYLKSIEHRSFSKK